MRKGTLYPNPSTNLGGFREETDLKRFIQLIVCASVLLGASLLSVEQAAAAGQVAYGETVLSRGMNAEEVVLLQEDLQVLGYFEFQVNTGYFGELTEKAVK